MSERKRTLMRENIMRFLLEERALAPEKPPTPISSPRKGKEMPKQTTPSRHRVDCNLSKKYAKPTAQSLSSCLTTTAPIIRMVGGANNPAERSVGKLAQTDSQCQLKAPGIRFLMKRNTILTTQEVKMAAPVIEEVRPTSKCNTSKILDNRPFKDQRTQTLYRESSAQTLAYLPDVLDKKQTLELFSLPSVLPGEGPPGLREVEILDRARQRWKFKEVLKTNLNILRKDAKENAIKSQYKPLLEAFEWEQWIQREEYIQECQMMRLEIVIKMFDKREKQMHSASKSRIEKACEEIEKRRQAALQKNEIQYNRGMRRLEMTLSKIPRKWEKQSPLESLGSMCSEFYAPLLRHGVDPARRSFVSKTKRKAFDRRIDELDAQVKMSNLICPFRKLKDWSKPKEPIREYEQNFCNEENLQNLFEDLRTLRTQTNENKEEPKCLIKRRKPFVRQDGSVFDFSYFGGLYDKPGPGMESVRSDRNRKTVFEWSSKGYTVMPEGKVESMKRDRYKNDLEDILNSFEGTYIGWVMQFLSDEMSRLLEQRKLHFFCMMAQKERWRREAAEGGLRQKENDLRFLYEELFQEINSANNEVATEYIDTILDTDVIYETENQSIISVTHMAKQIDADIERWLESFKLIQNPLTFVPLRMMLKDMVSPDLDAAQRRHESSLIVQHILEDVIFPGVWEELDPFDIGTTLTSDLVDRLIDNDLYLFSSDSEDGIPHKPSWYEARAIIRKLIRQAVPGRRWKEENERFAFTIFDSFLDDLFAEIEYRYENPAPVRPNDITLLREAQSHNKIEYGDDIRKKDAIDLSEFINMPSLSDTELKKAQLLTLIKKMKLDKITMALGNLDAYEESDPDLEVDIFIKSEKISPIRNLQPCLSEVCSITSTMDLPDEEHLETFKGHSRRNTREIDVDSTVFEVEGIIEDFAVDDVVEEKKIDVSEPLPEPTEESSVYLSNTFVQNFIDHDARETIEKRQIKNRKKKPTTNQIQPTRSVIKLPETGTESVEVEIKTGTENVDVEIKTGTENVDVEIKTATESVDVEIKTGTETRGPSTKWEGPRKTFSVIDPVDADGRHSVVSHVSGERRSRSLSKSMHQMSFIDLDNEEPQSGQTNSIFQSLNAPVTEQISDDELEILQHERKTLIAKSGSNLNSEPKNVSE
ncbi:uncharacterized protein [Drosophila bipectinata]|uniref:uncharacterized protein n=1 Tax=Drosophila bipectinata TaxID=42026 RepID=UPI001C8ACADF|nr:uncharacterized protein LOC122322200 [Drosophila bipectinata]